MKYTEENLYEYMESCQPVRVTTVDGQEYVGQCWAYSADISAAEYGVTEPFLDMGGIVLALSDIEEIQYIQSGDRPRIADYAIASDRTLEEIEKSIEKEKEISDNLTEWPEID